MLTAATAIPNTPKKFVEWSAVLIKLQRWRREEIVAKVETSYLDKFEFNSIYFELASRCNARCSYCYNSSTSMGKDIPYDKIIDVIFGIIITQSNDIVGIFLFPILLILI